jgi:nicotinamidase-related amidase
VPAQVLASLVDPQRTAIFTQECQGAIVGLEAGLPDLAAAARVEAIPNIARLLTAVRAARVEVVHCVVQRRADVLGSNHNAKLFAVARAMGVDIPPGSSGAEVVPELGPAESDVILSRHHGIGPMGGTDLDAVLRNMGVTTIVGVGVSVNIAITNFVMDAVNAAYDFVLPRDAVAGVPRDDAEAIIENTLSLLATVTTTDAVIGAWSNDGA